MSQNQFVSALVALLFVSSTLASAFALTYAFSTRELRRLQIQVGSINNRVNLAQALLNDTIEYGKRNPAIQPILQSLNLATSSEAPPTQRPVDK